MLVNGSFTALAHIVEGQGMRFQKQIRSGTIAVIVQEDDLEQWFSTWGLKISVRGHEMTEGIRKRGLCHTKIMLICCCFLKFLFLYAELLAAFTLGL